MAALWQRLFKPFDAPPADPLERQQVAMAVLLLECARADFEHSAVEMAAVRSGLMQFFGIDEAALDAVLHDARHQSRQAVSLHDYVSRLNASLQPQDKRRLIDMLWRVVYADGRLDPNEEHLLRRLADLLYVPHREYIEAKLGAERALDHG